MIGVAMELGVANPVPALNCLGQPSIAQVRLWLPGPIFNYLGGRVGPGGEMG
jgi:hypothetical protein